MDVQDMVREVGKLTEDDQLVRGALTVGAASLAVILTVWRAVRSRGPERVKVDAPANVEVNIKPK